MSSRDRSALEELGVTSAERTRLRRALDALEPDDEARVDPPAEVWAGISAALNDNGGADDRRRPPWRRRRDNRDHGRAAGRAAARRRRRPGSSAPWPPRPS